MERRLTYAMAERELPASIPRTGMKVDGAQNGLARMAILAPKTATGPTDAINETTDEIICRSG
jgi:hypothetical protein